MDPIPQHGNENDPLTDSGLSPPIQLLNIALSAMFSKISFPKFLIVHADLNRIQNLSLKDHNQKLILEAEEFKNRFKDTFLANFGGSDGTVEFSEATKDSLAVDLTLRVVLQGGLEYVMTRGHALCGEQMCHRHYATYPRERVGFELVSNYHEAKHGWKIHLQVASAGMGIASDIRDSQFSDDFVTVFSLVQASPALSSLISKKDQDGAGSAGVKSLRAIALFGARPVKAFEFYNHCG
ncbi:hypothetical protein Tco_1234893 [Tanacetum coccineum]